jgi:polar amino acid transport system substrate-binding protein
MKRLGFSLAALLLLGLLLAACGSQQASQEGHLGVIKKNGVLVVGTSADYPPYESKDEADNFVGFDMDLIREIGKRMGVEVEIKDMAFDSLIAAVQEKKVDVVIAAMQTSPERLEKVDFSNEYHMQKDAFISRADAAFSLASAKDAAGKAIGVQTGTIQEDWVLKNLVPLGTTEDQIFRYERVDQGALDVKAGRIDLLFINADPAAELVTSDAELKLALVTEETVVGGQAIAMPKGEAALKAEIDKWIKTLQDEGVIQQLQDKHNIP